MSIVCKSGSMDLYKLLIICAVMILILYLLFRNDGDQYDPEKIKIDRFKMDELISGSPITHCSALPILNSQGLINDASILCDTLKNLPMLPKIHFEDASENCNRDDYIFVNLDVTRFDILFQNPDSPKNILCKNFVTLDVLRKTAPKDFNIIYTGFTSIDRYDPNIAKDYSKLIHIAGKSPFKGTNSLVKIWILHPEWPNLTIICRGDIAKDVRKLSDNASNINIIDEYINEEQLNEYYNSHGVHLCPSKHEGFGHYLNEARSCKSIVLYTDGPPMNEMFEDDISGIKINSFEDMRTDCEICPTYGFRKEGLEKAINRLLTLDDFQRRNMGNRARQNYLRDKIEFRDNITSVVSDYFRALETDE